MIKRHFTATGIVLSPENKVLLVHHKKLGVWLPPGGHIEPNELPQDAVVREVLEETGIAAELLPDGTPFFEDDAAVTMPMPLAMLCENIGGQGDHFHLDMVYRMRAKGEAPVQNPGENTAVGWFSKDQLGIIAYDNARWVIARAMDDSAAGLVIAPARRRDGDEIGRLMEEWEQGDLGAGELFCGWLGARIACVLGAAKRNAAPMDLGEGPFFELAPVFVRPDLRGRGLGGKMLRHAFDHARALGAKQVFVRIPPGLASAAAFFSRRGFVHSGEKGEYVVMNAGCDGRGE